MEVKYLNQKDFDIDVAVFSNYIDKLKNTISVYDGDLNVVFVNDLYIRALNKSYRDKDEPTDVLSFNYGNKQGEEGIVGEVYISVETAKRQAKEYKKSLADELVKLLVHGLLHVHGYDHEKSEDYKKMYKVEKNVLGDIAGDMILSE